MKILSIGNFGAGWDGSICDEEHIAKALEELGHKVYRLQREEATPSVIHEYDTVDWVLIAQWDGFGDGIKCLSELSCPIVYWAFDYQADGQEWHERLVKEADLYLSKRIADSKYDNWQWLSQDFAPEFLHPTGPVEKDIEVLFTGSYLPWATERNETLKAVDDKFNLVIHSVNEWPGFKDVRPPIMDEGLPGLYARARIILSIDHTIEAGYWSDRNAQIIACGRRPLFRYVPFSVNTFREDVDYFYDTDSCIRQIDYKLNHIFGERINLNEDRYKVKARVKDLLAIVESIL